MQYLCGYWDNYAALVIAAVLQLLVFIFMTLTATMDPGIIPSNVRVSTRIQGVALQYEYLWTDQSQVSEYSHKSLESVLPERKQRPDLQTQIL